MKICNSSVSFLIPRFPRNVAVFAAATFIFCAGFVQAQPIGVPNHSFESQSGIGYPFGTNPNLDSWQKIAEPAYFTPAFGAYGIPWYGTAGGFIDTNPYGNRIGAQAGYILAAPQVTLFQDYDSSPTHDFNATFDIGKSYNLTLGLFGKANIAPGSTLQLSLYYRDNLNQKVVVGSTVVTYSAASFPISTNLNLIDYSVNVPTVQGTDLWAGKNIGIQMESTIPIEMTSFGNWDFDNVRLTAVPEPTTVTLLGIGVSAFVAARSLRRK